MEQSSTQHCSLLEVTQLLANAGRLVRLEVLPANQSGLPVRPQDKGGCGRAADEGGGANGVGMVAIQRPGRSLNGCVILDTNTCANPVT